MDALVLLRDANVRSETVRLDGDDLVFESGKRLARKTPTAFAMKGKGIETYTLDSLWFLLQNKDQSTRAYITECKNQGVERVQILDKKAVLDFLSGKSEDLPTLPGELAPVAQASSLTAPARDAAVEKDDLRKEVLAAISREKEQRTRDAILCMDGRSFKHVSDLLEKFLKKKEDERRNEAARAHVGAVAADPRGDRYRVNNERFYREEMGKEFTELGIDPSGTFQKSSVNKRPNPPMKMSRPMQGSEAFAKKPRSSSRAVNPIIIVPGARDMSALLNLSNLPVLLKDKTFRSVKDVLKEGQAALTPQVKLTRVSPRSGQPVEYLLISNLRQIADDDWSRVVAIVCQGAEWQFKGFPASMGKTPQQILPSLQGFYFYYAGDRIDNNVKNWKMKFLPVERNKRHEDVKVANAFWSTLDEYMKVHKPYLRW